LEEKTSQSKGDTNRVVRYIIDQTGFEFVDLKEKDIGHFDYSFKNQDDDFLPLMKRIVRDYDTIIFATPVYWYSMSGIMKVFFDRISDLLKIEKPTGRQLRGIKMGMISCSNADDRNPAFNMPFVESADYLGMSYLGDVHAWVEEDEIHLKAKKRIDDFLHQILQES